MTADDAIEEALRRRREETAEAERKRAQAKREVADAVQAFLRRVRAVNIEPTWQSVAGSWVGEVPGDMEVLFLDTTTVDDTPVRLKGCLGWGFSCHRPPGDLSTFCVLKNGAWLDLAWRAEDVIEAMAQFLDSNGA